MQNAQQELEEMNQRNRDLEAELQELKEKEEVAQAAFDDLRTQVIFQHSLHEATQKSFEESLTKAQQAVDDVKLECKQNEDDIGNAPLPLKCATLIHISAR